jgi:hypothetical protein
MKKHKQDAIKLKRDRVAKFKIKLKHCHKTLRARKADPSDRKTKLPPLSKNDRTELMKMQKQLKGWDRHMLEQILPEQVCEKYIQQSLGNPINRVVCICSKCLAKVSSACEKYIKNIKDTKWKRDNYHNFTVLLQEHMRHYTGEGLTLKLGDQEIWYKNRKEFEILTTRRRLFAKSARIQKQKKRSKKKKKKC